MLKTIYTIDTSLMDRDVAIIVYNNKIYEDSNHQYAFQEALKDEGKSLSIDIEENIDEVANLTHKLSKNNELYAFDWFSDGVNGYLVAHFEENLISCKDIIKEYAKKHNLKIGVFKDFQSDVCNIIEV